MDKIIVVNGREYYELTGLPVNNNEVTSRQSTKSNSIHNGPQKSKTLNRNFVKRPENLTKIQAQQIMQFKRKHDYEEAQKKAEIMNANYRNRAKNSPQVARFNSGVGSAKRVISPISKNDTAPIAPATIHPLQEKTREIMSSQKIANSTKELTLREQKNLAISRAIEKTNTNNHKAKSGLIPKKYFWQTKKFATSFATVAIVVLSFGYLTYINMPNISTRMAAVQAGIDANLPAYSPSGYKLDGLASYDGDSVNLTYQSDNSSFTLKQSKSSWDSVALLSNYVEPQWNGNYIATQEKGITIYTSQGEATWVNNGIIYKISGDSGLTNEQIRKIATSI